MLAALIPAAVLALGLAGAAHAGETPDESALRYYATQKQTGRVEAEATRLRRRHPGWQPPADLWTAQAGAEDEEGYWELFAAGRLAELKAALDARARAEPGWQPSRVLKAKLAQKSLRLSALDLAKAGRWPELAAFLDARRADRDAADVELTWAFAEALARSDRAEEAAALLRAILESPQASADERRATLLKALSLLSMAQAEPLIALGRPGEFAAVALDITRARISARLHDEAGVAVAPEALAAFATYAERADDPNQAGLVAWHAYKRRDFPEALVWFKRAIAHGGDAMIAHGLAHTLRELGHLREAEEVAYAWREPLVNNTVLFLDLLERDLTSANPPAIEPERLRRYAEVTAANASGEGAQALGWYAYNTCRFETALNWFSRAVAWFPKEATIYGYALSLRRLKRQRAFVETVNRYDGLFPKVVDLLFRAPEDRPMPCERTVMPEPAVEARAVTRSGYLDLAGTEPPAAGGRARRGQVPDPADLGAGAGAPPMVKRSEFPLAVQMENDLRFAPTGSGSGESLDGRWSARPIGRAPTVARRVPGVGPMPYERYGFSLLPGYDGADAPASPTAAERPAPLGTLWSDMRQGPPPEAPSPTAPADALRTGSIGPSTASPSQTPAIRRIRP